MAARAIRNFTSTLIWLLALACSTDDAGQDPSNTGGVGAGAAGFAGNAGSAAGGGGFAGKAAAVGGSGSGGVSAGSAGAAGSARGGRAGESGAGTAGAGAGTANAGNSGGGGAGGGGNDAAGGNAAGGVGGAGGSLAGAGGNHGGRAGTAGANGEGGAITIWIAGDSTVANASNCPIGWGAAFGDSFDERVTVTNRAVGGRSVRTWMYNVGTSMDASGECVLATDSSGMPTLQARWQEMLDGMQTGDYLFIQFGINDGSATCDRHVGLAAFKDSYGVLAEAAKARGTQPVFVTPVSAIACNGSNARGTRGSYVSATIEAGAEFDVPVIDLHQQSVELYDELGFCPIPGGSDVSASTGGEVGAFFCDDHTHFDRPGAERIAALVAASVAAKNLELAAYLK